MSEYNELPESKGELVPLKAKGNFQRSPYHEWTYFIRDAEGIKIGRSVHPRSRMRDLQGGNGSKLELLVAVPCDRLSEADAHAKFQHLRTHREWFRPEQELLDFIGDLQAEMKKPPRPSRETTRLIGNLYATRSAHGAKSAIGHRCSNLGRMIPAYEGSSDPAQRAFLAAGIKRTMSELGKLTA